MNFWRLFAGFACLIYGVGQAIWLYKGETNNISTVMARVLIAAAMFAMAAKFFGL